MNWPLIIAVFGALAIILSLGEWLSDIRKGKSSETGEPELVFPLLVTAAALGLAIWLTVEYEWHWSLVYILPASAQGAALAAMNQGGAGEGWARWMIGFIWPFGTAMLLKSLVELQDQPLSLKAYRVAENTDWADPVRSSGSQASFKWNTSKLYKLATGQAQFNYICAKMALARSEKDPRIRRARHLVCADLLQEMKRDGTIDGEAVAKLKREALDRYHDY